MKLLIAAYGYKREDGTWRMIEQVTANPRLWDWPQVCK